MALKRFTPQSSIPIKGDKNDKYNPNWLALQRGISALNPVCVGAPGDPGTISSSGALQTVTWTPVVNVLNDQTQIIGRTATDNLHLPVDGYYSFWQLWTVGDPITATFDFEERIEVADTSDSGYSTPTFSEPFAGDRQTKRFFSGSTIDNKFITLYLGTEFHANDLVRFRVRIDSSFDLNNTKVLRSEFRLVYPIPNRGPI